MTFAADVKVAEAYDHWFDRGWGKYAFGIETKALLKAAGSIAGLRALDAGSGTGRFTAELVRRGAFPVGVDRDGLMLTVAKRRRSRSLVLADAGALPFADAAFDIAFAVTLCEFVDNVGQVFSELARVTRPGGRFVVGNLNPKSPWGFFNRERFRHAPWTSARFLTRQQLVKLGSQHGVASLSAALYAPENLPGAQVIGPALELLGRLAPGLGAFQVLVVDLPA
ncbi:MAG TPA: methyltransferase domain-containing protein [Dehalococcoidia bacterium]|nr:methyltransferase domain-containing protein [Dehalococcoidia bacterium]